MSGPRWEVTCSHPESIVGPGLAKLPPTTFRSLCEHNWCCPTCGYGGGTFPCPCFTAA